MATTYGEQLLSEAEDRSRRRRQQRRLALVFAPAAVAIALAGFRTVSIRNAADDAGLIATALDAGAVLGYALLLVAAPLYLGVVPRLRATATAVAAIAGPIGMPIVFGPGWRWWHRGVVLAACLLVIVARRSQPTRTTPRRPRVPRR